MIPVSLPGRGNQKNEGKIVLAADIGGTKTNLALFKANGNKIDLIREGNFPSGSYDTFDAILNAFLKDGPVVDLNCISIGVAGPVMGSRVKLTNLPWLLDKLELQRAFNVSEVYMINDLRATAYGLAGLNDELLTTIQQGNHELMGNIAILAPGTGLGEAGLYWDGVAYHPFATEGGHCHFSPQNELDVELYQYVRKSHPMMSWEHVLSGSGIHRIYRFLREVKGHPEPAWLRQRFEMDDPAAVISHTAMRELNDTCIQTMEIFVRYLAVEAANLVLKLKATGGLFLGGGIPPKIYPLLKEEVFRKHFTTNDLMQDLLEEVPIKLILDAKTALVGAGYHGAFYAIPE